VYPFGDLDRPSCVLADFVHQKDAIVLTHSHLFSELMLARISAPLRTNILNSDYALGPFS
jgi:hypothetical protein